MISQRTAQRYCQEHENNDSDVYAVADLIAKQGYKIVKDRKYVPENIFAPACQIIAAYARVHF
jgi:hypothetical protein